MNTEITDATREKEVHCLSGWTMLPVIIAVVLGSIAMIISLLTGVTVNGWFMAFSIIILIVSLICLSGFFTLQPNEARILILFGSYKGTVKTSGFHWANPFYMKGFDLSSVIANSAAGALQKPMGRKDRISLRARNLNGEKLKVNDKRGNPIEIAAVVVWRVQDTAKAIFDVDNYENYIQIQSESAVRHLASCYGYDHGEDKEITLQTNIEEVSQALKDELHERLGRAGIVVEDARLSHLAYAPEIAQAMLRRQQAEAVIAARQKIVHGAVSMVEMALQELTEKQVVHLDDERKAAMVSNLMVVLCSETSVNPIVNAGTLYS